MRLWRRWGAREMLTCRSAKITEWRSNSREEELSGELEDDEDKDELKMS